MGFIRFLVVAAVAVAVSVGAAGCAAEDPAAARVGDTAGGGGRVAAAPCP